MSHRICLVTGASGHLGSELVRELLRRGEHVRCLVMENTCPPALVGLDVELVHGDISQKSTLYPFFAGLADYREVCLYHLASMITLSEKVTPRLLAVNVGGVENLLELAQQQPHLRLLYCSSVHALPEKKYGAPISEVKAFHPDWVRGAYAKSKAIASQKVMEAAQAGFNAVIALPSGIIGRGDYEGKGRLNRLIADYLHGKLFCLVEGGYDIGDVRDYARGLIRVMEQGRRGESYILSNHYYSLKEVIDQVAALTGKAPLKWYIRLSLATAFASIGECIGRHILRQSNPLYTPYSVYTLASNGNFDHRKASQELGYRTRDFRDTLIDTLDFIRSSGAYDHP